MYIIKTEIELKKAKGRPILQNKAIQEAIEHTIMPKITLAFKEIFEKNGIVINTSIKTEWVNIKKAEFKDVGK